MNFWPELNLESIKVNMRLEMCVCIESCYNLRPTVPKNVSLTDSPNEQWQCCWDLTA